MIAFLAICLLAGGALAWRLKPQSIGDYLKLSIDARTARARADQVMRQRGVDPNANYRAVVFVNNADSYANEYLRSASVLGESTPSTPAKFRLRSGACAISATANRKNSRSF